MGHSEMLLAVAGLDEESLTDRTRRLASGDWSSFSARERAAFHFANKLAKEPSEVTAEDVNMLSAHFGTQQAIDVIWWTASRHYLTTVADAFQIPLEHENVFRRGGSRSRENPRGR